MAKLTILRNKKGRRIGVVRSSDPVLNLDKPTRKAVAKIAKKVVNTAAETKYVAEILATEPVAIYGSTTPTGGLTQLYDLCPAVQEGDGPYQRSGVKIVPTKHAVDVNLTFNTNPDLSSGASIDNCSWDINVHMWYGFVRRYKNAQDVLANGTNICNNLFDLGDGATQGWEGGQFDHLHSINKEWFSNLKHKVFRMYRPLGQQNEATVAGGLTTYFPQTIHKTVRLTFKTPKVLMFNENNTIPENYAPILIIGYQHNDGSQASNKFGAATPPVLGIPALQMMYKTHLWFKDV